MLNSRMSCSSFKMIRIILWLPEQSPFVHASVCENMRISQQRCFNKFDRKLKCILVSAVTWVLLFPLFMNFKIYNYGQIISL